MDTGKRKRPASRESGGDEVSEDEVEEFFAIICRMRELSRCFAVKGEGTAWRPAFKREDFEAEDAVKNDGRRSPPPHPPVEEKKREAAKEVQRSLDLNADPE